MLIIILQGMWSDVIFARGSTSVFGKSRVQFGDVKNSQATQARDQTAYYSTYRLFLSRGVL